MELLIAIVQDEDAKLLCEKLAARGLRNTRLNTVGGFLARGNVTVLAGVEETQVEEALSVIRATCHARRHYINPLPQGADASHLALPAFMPLEVLVGGATVFIQPVRRFLHLTGGAAVESAEHTEPRTGAQGGTNPMNLVLAIVQSEDADAIVRALLAAGHRVTRINTAGGFLRRGNATLLIGVEEAQVDAVLAIIQTTAQARTAPGQTGASASGATVFVLETERFLHV